MKKFFCGEQGACKKCGRCKTDGKIRGIFFHKPVQEPEKIPLKQVAEGCRKQEGYGIAIDIGTTTIAFELFNLQSGESMVAYACINSQRNAFGSDVMTRITHAIAGDAVALHECIVRDLARGIEQILLQVPKIQEISRIVICGNTTMLHFLQNFPVEGLGRYPFTPFSVAGFNGQLSDSTMPEIIKACRNVFILPGVSAFLGADIVAGLLHCGAGDSTNKNAGIENFLYLDLGTNAEMAVFGGFSEKIYVTSAAAGPAFEKMRVQNLHPQIVAKCDKFISFNTENHNDMFAADIITLAAQNLREGTFNPRDFADFLLAKAAVRAGLEILLAEAGLSCENVAKVFIAGGFGYKINATDATAVGLFPQGLEDKVFTVGNAALGGAARVLLNLGVTYGIPRALPNPDIACDTQDGFQTTSKHLTHVDGLARNMTEIPLATHPQFEELFLKNMEIL